MLTVADLVVEYGRVRAVQNVSLTVAAGEIVSVVGPNGAGKTSLLNAIAGAVAPSHGEVIFNGKRLTGSSPEQVVRQGIALVPEARHIFGQLTVAENLQLGTTARRDRTGLKQHMEEILTMFPVLRRTYRSSAGQLSGGEQQQLAIARALIADPKLLLLDEPSLGLAPVLVDLVFEVLKQLNQKGVTILLVEQFVQRAREIADRTHVLRAGRVALTVGKSGEDEGSLEGAYFGLAGNSKSN